MNTPDNQNVQTDNTTQNKPVFKRDHVPFKTKVAYGAGGMMDWLSVGLTVNSLWMPVFNIGYGIAPGVLGVLLMIFRAWDAVADPIMGTISDNTRTRWGRRRPYVVIGAVLVGLLMPVLWNPITIWGNTGLIIYLCIIGLLLYTSFTIWAMPYYSLMLEMTPDYDERTHVAAYRAFFTKAAILIGGWVLALASSNIFANANGTANIARGMSFIGFVIGLVVILLGVLPGIFVKERYYEKESMKQDKVGLFQGLKDTFSILPFWFLCGIVFFQVLGQGVVNTLGQYLNIYYINSGEQSQAFILEGWKMTIIFAVGASTIPFWTWVSEKLDKPRTLGIILMSGFIGTILNLYCLTPEHPYYQLIPAIFNAGVMNSIWLLVPSFQADLVDYDELRTAKRREGSINSVFSFLMKLAFTLSAGLSGFVLEWTGFDISIGSAQGSDVLMRMFGFYVFAPVCFWFIALMLLFFYPLNRQKMAEVRQQLEARRGEV